MSKFREFTGPHLAPVLAALAVWLALAAVVVDPAWGARARECCSWMLDPVFHDWHVVQRGRAVAAAGHDPLADLTEPFNYPRLVLLGARPGAPLLPVSAQGLVLAGLLLAALVVALQPRTWRDAGLAVAFVLSLPVLLLVERGNLDAVAFVLVVGGLLLLVRGGSRRVLAALGAAALLLAALLKLFPFVVLAGAAFYWRDRRQRWLIGALLVGIAWCILNGDEVALVLRKTLRGLEPAYGRMLFTTRLQLEGWWSSHAAVRAAAWSGLAVCAGGVLAAARWGAQPGRFGAARWSPWARAAGLAGGLVYVGTYLLGFNWAYRLVFLALCLPALGAATRNPATRMWAWSALASVGVVVLAPVHQELGWFAVVQAAGYLLLLQLASLVAALLIPGETGAPGSDLSPAHRPAVRHEPTA